MDRAPKFEPAFRQGLAVQPQPDWLGRSACESYQQEALQVERDRRKALIGLGGPRAASQGPTLTVEFQIHAPNAARQGQRAAEPRYQARCEQQHRSPLIEPPLLGSSHARNEARQPDDPHEPPRLGRGSQRITHRRGTVHELHGFKCA
ncbi:hypothetical protein VARIO8X_110279 [Burkholderiales bacterium 8X]|nr:hypothetical protein VARIO8X_110279 [Burkholderiales bacterium 8X]